MQLFEQFSRLKYDTTASRLPISFILFVTVVVVLALQWQNGLTAYVGGLFFGNALLFSILIWFAVPIYEKIKSFYFVIQGLFIVSAANIVPSFSIIILITFGALLVVQSFYFYNRMRQFLSYLVVYILFGSGILFVSYGVEELSFYLLVFILSLILVFLVLMIFNQKELENIALAEANDRIELLTRQNERQRMARDLHDSLIQKLIALNLKMDVIEAHVKKGRLEKAEAVIDMAKLQIGESIVEARKVVDDLRLNMNDLTLKERLFEELQQLQYIFDLRIEHVIQAETEPSQQLANNIVALVKEAVTNVYKHANATKVAVQFIEKDTLFHLTITDDGDGIDLQEALKKEKRYGLLGMQERIALFDGHLRIEDDGGTRLVMQFPIERM